MIYGKQDYHKTPGLFFLIWEDYSMGQIVSHDVHYGTLHSKQKYLWDHNNCKSPVVVLQGNVPESILHLMDEIQLKRKMKITDIKMR